ncbi:hypothetical protein DESME_03590 [Desulfitobacterium metallireducens DSM 15288]|uniref:Uncharacterized protein n=1 Tax=Desulfitobacterium metallireducens DSM 15288 TaxID=871968 RepID=W0EG09_9FIRM|nr:hypothetical protein DESME_03590 [Desulfitobacterium metallireducens DSM 15288]
MDSGPSPEIFMSYKMRINIQLQGVASGYEEVRLQS